MMQPPSQNVNSSKDFDIEDVDTLSDAKDRSVIQSGTVETWEHFELAKKAKPRLYITSVVITLWVVCLLVGLFRWFAVGDMLLFISTPALLLSPMHYVLRYYFRE